MPAPDTPTPRPKKPSDRQTSAPPACAPTRCPAHGRLGGLQFLCSEAVLESPRDFLFERSFETAGILRRIDRLRHEYTAFVERTGLQLRSDAVAEPIFLANSCRQP